MDQNAGTQAQKYEPPTMEQFLEGQKQINGIFYYVNSLLLETLTELRDALENSHLNIDLTAVSETIEKARELNAKAPGVIPPGCTTGGGGGGITSDGGDTK